MFSNKWAFLGLQYFLICILAISFMFYNKPCHKYCSFEVRGKCEMERYRKSRFEIQ